MFFIEAGLKAIEGRKEEMRILEMGFGTGLNAWLSWHEATKSDQKIAYHGLEKISC
jgi:tRNA U34 5-methylaminomethyl-2-thiouridine-forming methyltransferase MnmC